MSGRNFKALAGAEAGAATAKLGVKGGGIAVRLSIGVALSVMAGLVPAIHAVRLPECSRLARPSVSGQSESAVRRIGVDGRDKPGQDGVWAIRSAPTAPGLAVTFSPLFRPERPLSALQRLSRRPIAERAPDSAQGLAAEVPTKKSPRGILFFKICGRVNFSCLTNENRASVRLGCRRRRSRVRKNSSRGGEKIWRNAKRALAKFFAP